MSWHLEKKILLILALLCFNLYAIEFGPFRFIKWWIILQNFRKELTPLQIIRWLLMHREALELQNRSNCVGDNMHQLSYCTSVHSVTGQLYDCRRNKGATQVPLNLFWHIFFPFWELLQNFRICDTKVRYYSIFQYRYVKSSFNTWKEFFNMQFFRVC